LYAWLQQTDKEVDWFDNTEGGDPQVGMAADDVMMERALEKLDKLAEQDSPWTLTIAFSTPHTSFAYLPNGTMTPIVEGCSRYFEEFGDEYSYNRGVICQRMNDLDLRFDELIQKLIVLDLWDDTLVIFVNDNGADPGQSRNTSMANYGLNWPYRGGKYTFYEGGIRTVLSLGGGVLPDKYKQQVNLQMHDIVDVAATILAVGGFSNEDLVDRNIDGVSLIDISSAEYGTHEILYHSMPSFQHEHEGSNNSVINWMGKKYIGADSHMTYMFDSWATLPREDSIKGTGECSNWGCLYDLDSDPYEMTDLSGEDTELTDAFNNLVRDVVNDAAFNDGIVYSKYTDCSATYLSFGNRTYHYYYPWLDTPKVLDEPRRLREMRRDSFNEMKRRRRSINLKK
jgi:arylsulfatase A-like enzyme